MSKRSASLLICILLMLALVLAACNRDQPAPDAAPVPAELDAAQETLPAEGSPSADQASDTTDNVTGNVADDAAGSEEVMPEVAGDDHAAETNSTQPQTNQTQPALTGTITLWHSWAGAEGDALAQILQEYGTRYPGVQVDTLFVAHDDLLQSYAEAVMASNGPTVLLAPNWWLSEMVLLQLVTPFGPELAQSTLDALFPAARESMIWDEHLYGVPVHVTVPALYINTSLYGGAPPQTLDQWRQLAQSAPQQGIGLYANLYHLAWGLEAFDATLFDAQGRVVLDDGPGTTEFLAWLAGVNALDGSFADQDYGMLMERFKQGEFAFFVDGPWSMADFAATFEGTLAVAPLPHGPDNPASPWLYAEGLFLNPNADDAARRLAVTFAQHLTSESSAEALVFTGGLLPANRAIGLPSDHLLTGFHIQAQTATAMPLRREMDTVWGYGGDLIIRALVTATDLDDAVLRAELTTLVAETTTLINEANGR